MISKLVKILWADDEIDLLKSHIIFLEEKGFKISTVSSGEEAVDTFKKNKYDLVLLDEMMAGIDGIETLRMIKKINPLVPIVMVTKNEQEWLMDEAIASEISDYLIKPVNPNQIFLSCKKILSSDRIQSDRIVKDFLDNYNSIKNNINTINNLSDWMAIIDDVIEWEIRLDKINESSILYFLGDLKKELNKNFTNFIENSYPEIISSSCFPNSILDQYVKPQIKADQKVALIVLDCLRYDQGKMIIESLFEKFDVSIKPALSFLPTTTEYSRNSIFSGLLPAEIKDFFPNEWSKMNRDETKLNKYENIFLESYCKKNFNNKVKLFYDKIIEMEQGQKIKERIKNYRNIDLISIVVNFIDILGHASVKSKAVKEMISNDKSYRIEVKNWFENSWLYEVLMEFKDSNRKIIITSDHGTTIVKNPTIIKADKNTSTGLRYKKGKNLNVNSKDGITIKNPGAYFLPSTSDDSDYIIAKSDSFFVYPNDFNFYKKTFENTYQHGGLSIDEMVIPIIELK